MPVVVFALSLLGWDWGQRKDQSCVQAQKLGFKGGPKNEIHSLWIPRLQYLTDLDHSIITSGRTIGYSVIEGSGY